MYPMKFESAAGKIISLLLIVLSPYVFSQTQGPNSGGAFQNTSLAGSSSSWSNPSNAASFDGANATAGPVTTHTDYLVVTGFGFSVPAGRVITGIEVQVYKNSDDPSKTKDHSVMIVKNGVIGGSVSEEKALSSSWQGQGVPSWVTYGGPYDTWGESWTDADINSGNFGLAFSAEQSGNGTPNISVDQVTIKVYYTDVVLPVALLNFSCADLNNSEVEIRWSTAMEKENNFFVIERSADMARNYEMIGKVIGAGNSSSRTNYTYTDQSPLAGLSYYRLKQVSMSGIESGIGKVIAVSRSSSGTTTLVVYPNPSSRNNMVYVCLNNFVPGKEVLVVVTDMLGKEYFSKVILTCQGRTIEAVDPSRTLAPGIYIVTGSSDNQLYKQRIVIR